MIMLDTNHCLSFEPTSLGSPPLADDIEKAGLKMDHDRLVYHSLKEGGLSDISDVILFLWPSWDFLFITL